LIDGQKVYKTLDFFTFSYFKQCKSTLTEWIFYLNVMRFVGHLEGGE